MVGGISDRARVEKFLKTRHLQQATIKTIATAHGWSIDKAKTILAEADRDPTCSIYVWSGGIVKYRGTEIGSSVGIYQDIIHVLSRGWQPLGCSLRAGQLFAKTYRNARTGYGQWSRPDLVMAAYPARRASRDEARRLHAIEVEQANGFDLRSIYQAHAQGLGADYTWVFACTNYRPGYETKRIERAADELNVGLITFTRPATPKTWTTRVTARRMNPTDEDRADFIERALSAHDRDELALPDGHSELIASALQ